MRRAAFQLCSVPPVGEVSAAPAAKVPTAPADPGPEHEAPAEPSAPVVSTGEIQPKASAEAGTEEAASSCDVSAAPSRSRKSSVASKPSRVTRIKLLKSLRRTVFGSKAEVKRAPKRSTKKCKAESVKEEDEVSDGIPPRPKAKVKSKAMPRPRGTVRASSTLVAAEGWKAPMRRPRQG